MASGAAIRAGRAFVEFFIEDGRLERGLKTIERRLMMFGRRISNIGRQAFTFATTAAIALAFPLTGFAQFDDKIKELESLAKRGATSMQELREQAKQLGRDTSFTAIDVAGGQTEMARAGFDTDEIKRGTEDMMNLARATRSEIPRATEIAAGALRSFNLPIDDLTRVVNVAVGTVNRSAIGIEDYAEAMKMAGPAANQFGQSIEETSKQIGILGNLQIKGSLAGTAMRNAMLRIADPKIRAGIEAFTPIVDKSTGRIKDLSQIMTELGTATAGEGPEKRLERMALFTKLFGVRSVTAAMILSQNVAEGFDDAFSDPAFAANIAKHMDSGIGGVFRRLKSAWEGVTIAFGEAVDSMLSRGADGLTKVLGVVRMLIDNNPILAKTLIAVVAGLFTAGIAGLALGFMIQGLGLWFRMLSGALVIVKSGLMLTAGAMQFMFATILAMNPILLGVVGAIAALAIWFVYASGAIQKAGSFLRENFGAAWETIVQLLSSGHLAAAFELAMTLMRVSAVIALAEIKALWFTTASEMESRWQGLTGGLAGLLIEATAGAEVVWMQFTGMLVDAFHMAIAKIKDIMDSLTRTAVAFLDDIKFKLTGFHTEAYYELKFNQQHPPDYVGKERVLTEARQAERQKEIEQIRKNASETVDTSNEMTQQNKKNAVAGVDEKVADAQREANRARAEFDQAHAKANALLEPSKEEESKRKKAEEEQRLRDLFNQGPSAARGEHKANEAMLLQSKEGASAIAKALGFAGQQDKVVNAIGSMQEAVVAAVGSVETAIEDDTDVEPW